MIPKSLHTVTALVNVARFVALNDCTTAPANAIALAASVLGYTDSTPDIHGLKAKAVAVLKRVRS